MTIPARVTYLPLSVEPGHSLSVFVSPRIDPATRDHFELGYNQVFVDPVSGKELGRREWGAVGPISRETFVSFLYVLHYSLHIPEMWGIDEWGLWLMGSVAIVWMLDAFVGFYLTLPKRREQRDGCPAAPCGTPPRRRDPWGVRCGRRPWHRRRAPGTGSPRP